MPLMKPVYFFMVQIFIWCFYNPVVWSMKPADENKYTLEARLKNYSNELLAPKNIFCAFDIDGPLAAAITKPGVRKNILQTAKEAINDIAKYSKAAAASVVLKQQEDKIFFIISHNGKGYIESGLQQGNGLPNIRQRCSHLNGHCDIISQTGNGVTVTCTFPEGFGGKENEEKG